MKPKRIMTEAEYEEALRRVEDLARAPLGSAKAEELDAWVREIDAFEARRDRALRNGHDRAAEEDA